MDERFIYRMINSLTYKSLFLGEKLPLSQFEGVTMLSLDTLFKYFNSDLGRSVEMPSANANCSARGQIFIVKKSINFHIVIFRSCTYWSCNG